MAFRSLAQLLAQRSLERKPPDQLLVRQWAELSTRDLGVARDLLADIHPHRATSIAYEAGLRACLGILSLAGYRVTHATGHHRATIEGAAAILGPSHHPLLKRLDRARRARNDALYGLGAPLGRAQLHQLFSDVSTLLAELEARLVAPR